MNHVAERMRTWSAVQAVVIAVCVGMASWADNEHDEAEGRAAIADQTEYEDEFGLEARVLMTAGKNPYFILEPGFQLTLENSEAKLIITVLDDTQQVGRVLTRVVEEREWKEGRLIEVSRNFFAIDKTSNDVFYFGEDVDEYENGKIVKHSGAWRAYEDDAKPGLIMPGSPKPGRRYYQEIAPGEAMDRAEVISLNEKLKTPAGEFTHCLRTREGSALNPHENEFKTYAAGIGLLQDEDLLLVSYGYKER